MMLGGYTLPGAICRVYINDGYDPKGVRYNAVLQHETAHCYGWLPSHRMTRN
jgi:hypothetical protein